MGDRFCDWTVIGPAYTRPCGPRYSHRHVPVRCLCGEERDVALHSLKRWSKPGCGYRCALRSVQVGMTFGDWTVTELLGGTPLRVKIRCVCGTERDQNVWSLRNSKGSRRCRSCAARERSTRHGHHATGTYRSWQGMNHRCHSPNDVAWEYYGGRGIMVCDRWRSESYGGTEGAFLRFLADMGERPDGRTLDRIDSDSNYEPGNCRWATPLEQTANRTMRRRLDRLKVNALPT